MLVEIRIYRRHDADIMMLKSYGVNISKLMKSALTNYVSGQRVKYKLPGSQKCDISNCTMLRYRLNIKDPEVVSLLKSIKRGYRNQFCKALVRDSLESESLGVFFEDKEYIEAESERLSTEIQVEEINLDNRNKTFSENATPTKSKTKPAPKKPKKQPKAETKETEPETFTELGGNNNQDKNKKDAELMSMFNDMMSDI